MTEVRDGAHADDGFIAEAFVRMWIDIGHSRQDLVPDAEGRTLEFVADARHRLDFRSAIAVHEGQRIGCAAAQKFAGLYPNVLEASHRQYGYIWGVYVDPKHRRAGLGRRLTEHCVEAMRAVGCSHVVLHAAPMGLSVYQDLGFTPTQELRLEL